jgi:hypothetical protein
VSVYGILENTNGATGLAFAAPFPANTGFMLLGSGSDFSMTGNPESGAIIDFGTCITQSTVVMVFSLFKVSSGDPCTFFHLTRHPDLGEVAYFDCQSVQHTLSKGSGIVLNYNGCSTARPAYDPFPPDGATNVAIQPSLEWTFDVPDCGDLGDIRDNLCLGTTPDPPIYRYTADNPSQVGPLQPSTTYYWKVASYAYGNSAISPVWSFTTTNSVAVRPTTWGAIKALYR